MTWGNVCEFLAQRLQHGKCPINKTFYEFYLLCLLNILYAGCQALEWPCYALGMDFGRQCRLFLERIGRICFSNSEGRDKYAMRWLWKISLKETNNYGASSMLQILGQMLHKLFPLIWSWTSCLMMDGSNGSPFDGWGNADLARRLRTDPGPASA